MDKKSLATYAIYDKVPEHPNKYVALRWYSTSEGTVELDQEFIQIEADLEVLKTRFSQMGLIPFVPSPDDDPKLVLSYI